MARKTGQVIRRGPSSWLVRIICRSQFGNPETQAHPFAARRAAAPAPNHRCINKFRTE